MNAFEILLTKRWIVKETDKDLYYKVKDELGSIKKFFTEKMGYQIIENPYLIKLEKIPSKPQRWMGITEFTDKIQYIFLCYILMFLEDRDSGEQFLLSELLEYIQMNSTKEPIDWTYFPYRRYLVSVIKTCINYSMIKVNDGSSESFTNDYEQEVLYENMGTSRYFMRNFARDIRSFEKPEDFSHAEWIGVDEDRGVVRRHRVYRKLITMPGMYKEGDADEDFIYLKNQRNMIRGELSSYFDCEVDVHKTSAYLILGEECGMGKVLPSQSIKSDILLLCNDIILDKINDGDVITETDENIFMTEHELRSLIESCKKKYNELFSKMYRELTSTGFYHMVREEMMNWSMIEPLDDGRILVRPIVGKVIGHYSDEIMKRVGKDQMKLARREERKRIREENNKQKESGVEN